MGRYGSPSWSTMGLILCLLFALFLPGGISMLNEANQKYDLPIYISQKLSVTGYSSYTVTGELTNNSDRDVVIERLEITLTGKKEYTSYVTDFSINNITVPANSSYEIHSPGHTFQNEHGGVVASGELSSARISDCVIDGKSVELKEYDGTNFVEQGVQPGGAILAIVTGSIALLGAIAIVIYKVKTRYD